MRLPTTLLTPAMSGLLERLRRAGRTPLHALGVNVARVAYLAGAEVLDLPRAALDRVEDLMVADRPARLYAPSSERLPLLLYLHGGGFVVGGLETHGSLCRQLARRSGGAVIALDYRLAPEHRFPAAQDDAWQALRWLATHASDLGLDTRRIAVGGDSAGGTLAAVAAIRARDEGIAYADRLRAAGVPAQLDLVRGVTHDFIKMGRALKQAGATQQFVAEALAEAWRSIP